MGDLHHLRDEHEQAQMLLPWHVNGTLEAAEAAWFEAHLAGCAECRAEFEANMALRREFAAIPVEVEPVRVPVFERIGRAQAPAPRPWAFLRRRITLGWALAGQAAFAALVAGLVFTQVPSRQDDSYRLLGSEPAGAQGNVIVLFDPDTAERDMRDALNRAGARLVDGPTASGAYVVRVPEAEHAAALEELRRLPQVVLAEPIGGGGTS